VHQLVKSVRIQENHMKSLIAIAALALALPALAEETKLGAGVALKEVTPIEDVIARPADFVGKTIRVDGVATAVCTHMGCWMAVAPEGDAQGATVRVKVDDGVIVFPVTAKGSKVSAEGVFEAVGTSEEAKAPAAAPSGESASRAGAAGGGGAPPARKKEADGEHAKADPKASQQYQLKATGAVIR
jgi:hypothetical protein